MTRTDRRGVVVAMGLIAICGPGAAGQPTASFRSLGSLTTDPADQVVAKGISADGRVIVGDVFTSDGLRAFRWSLIDGMQPLGSFPNPGGAQYSSATAISADGTVIVGGSMLPNSLNEQGSPFRWTQAAGLSFLGSLGGTDGGIAYAVSGDGSVIGGYGSNPDFRSEGFRWTQSLGMTAMGGLITANHSSRVGGISGDGSTIVGFSSAGFQHTGWRWTQADGMLFISPVGLAVLGISADGSTMVGQQGGALTRAFTLQGTTLTQLPRLQVTGANDSDAALAVSADGSVVVGFANRELDSNVSEQAFMWDAVNGTRSIQAILTTQYGLNLTGWGLKEATAVSADGKTIAGWGYGPPGQTRQLAWVAQFGDSTTGNCCAAAGTCTVTTKPACVGNWSAGGSCAPGACPVIPAPTGRCCTPAGDCTVTTQPACTAGAWARGGGCEPNPCQPPEPMGACCNSFSPDCNVTSQSACFGDWTDGLACTPTTCPGPFGACCMASGACINSAQNTCPAGSTFQIFGTCDPSPCPAPTGHVCCRGVTCAVLPDAMCIGDSFSPARINTGAAANCSASSSAGAGCCAADYDQGGTVGVGDIFRFLTAWFALSPFSDASGNGTVDVPDIFIFLGKWFAGC